MRRALKVIALLLALALWTVNFGLIDLIDGFTGSVDQGRNQVLDVGWGAVFGIILPLGLLAQLHRPERRIAGLQQTALVAAALAVTGATGAEWGYLVLAGALAAATALLVALHPARREFARPLVRPRPLLLLPAAAAAVPCLLYAQDAISAQRRQLPPADAVSNGLHHWSIMAAFALLLVLLPLLAALGPNGWWIPVASGGLASLAWGVSCLLAPDAAGAEGRGWALAACAWAGLVIAAALWDLRGRAAPALAM